MDATQLPPLEAEDAHKIDRKSVRRPRVVARKHAISSGLLYTWRQQLLGAQIAPPARSAPTFAQVEIAGVKLMGWTAPAERHRVPGVVVVG